MVGGDILIPDIICFYKCPSKNTFKKERFKCLNRLVLSGLVLFNRRLVWNTSCSKHAYSLGKVMPNIYLIYLHDISSC